MKHSTFSFFTFILLIPSIIFCQNQKEKIRFFYLGGQSNMVGHGYNSELPKSLKKPLNDVWIYHGNPVSDEQEDGGLGVWEELKPGHGKGFSSDGIKNELSERFGVELSFAQKLKAYYPNEKIAIIKYSRGGSSIDSLAARHFGSWEADYVGTTGLNQYDYFLKTVRDALAVKDIDGDGKEDILIPNGIMWMQGESDASIDETLAYRYYDNLKRLMDLMRATFRTNDLAVVIGKISDSWNSEGGEVRPYGEIIQYAQEKYIKTDANAKIIRNTRYYKYSDPYHYDSEGYIDLGIRFAETIFNLNQELSK